MPGKRPKRTLASEGRVLEVLEASADRVEPRCAHFGVCGGCSLQHLAPEAQIRAKQQILLENLKQVGDVTPTEILAPLTGPPWGYRRKARLSVKYVAKKGKVLVGFREKRSPFIAELQRCEILPPSVGYRLGELSALIGSLRLYNRIPQIEVALGDERTALVVRTLDQPCEEDREKLRDFGDAYSMDLYLQPGGPDSLLPLGKALEPLCYRLPAHDVDIQFLATDFIQINAAINAKMVDRVLELLDLQGQERVLDLFCGLGNFTLPVARRVSEVVGVEADAGLIQRARANAQNNGIDNARFYAANLAAEVSDAPWLGSTYAKALLDPPRVGAQEILGPIAKLGVNRLVYVSCNPATLARDAGILVHRHGYHLAAAGVMDMFPHTTHVESMALFLR